MLGDEANLIRDEFPSLGPEGVETLSVLLDRFVPCDEGEKQFRACQELLEGTAEELGLLIGPRGVEAVLERALIIARVREPAIDHMVAITRERIELSQGSGERGFVSRLFCRYYLTAMEVTSSLIGFDLVEPVLRRVELRREEQGSIP